MKDVRLLKTWLKQPGNTPAILASELGYKSSATINQWIKKGRIPAHALKHVLNIVDKSKGKNK